MLGFGALGELALGEFPRSNVVGKIGQSTDKVALSVFSLIIPDNSLVLTEKKVAEGRLSDRPPYFGSNLRAVLHLIGQSPRN
jgi:hypothetical protein